MKPKLGTEVYTLVSYGSSITITKAPVAFIGKESFLCDYQISEGINDEAREPYSYEDYNKTWTKALSKAKTIAKHMILETLKYKYDENELKKVKFTLESNEDYYGQYWEVGYE